MLTPVGELRHLSQFVFMPLRPIHSSAFLKATPAFGALQRLRVALDLDLETSGVLPPLPSSKAEDVTVCLNGGALDAVEAVCDTLGSCALFLKLLVMPLRDGEDEQAQPAYRSRFNNIFRPFTSAHSGLHLYLGADGRAPISRHLLDWPKRCGGVCIIIETPSLERCETIWCLGHPLACLKEVNDIAHRLQSAGRRARAWARRGDGWTAGDIAQLANELGSNVEVVWE